MSLLNWSLKLHIRLRTILYLVSTHITHVYVQWMSYSFVWLYLINVLFILNHMLIKHKNIFLVFLVVFGKCFVLKIFKKSKIFFFTTLFWQLTCGSCQLLWLSSKWVSQLQKTLWKFFEISEFLSFSQLILVTWSRVEALVESLHRRFRNLPTGGPSNREKNLEKILKILFKGFSRLILATCSQVNWVATIACFA